MNSRRQALWFLALLVAVAGTPGGRDAAAQSVSSGRVLAKRSAGVEEKFPFSTVLCFASTEGPGREAHSFRTWEMEPADWWRIDGAAGNYTLLFTQPPRFFRPVVPNNIFVRPGEKVDRLNVSPRFDFALRRGQTGVPSAPSTDR